MRPRVSLTGGVAGRNDNSGGLGIGGVGGSNRGVSGMKRCGRRPSLGADGKRSSAGRVSGGGNALGYYGSNDSGLRDVDGERGNFDGGEGGYSNNGGDGSGGGGGGIRTEAGIGDTAESAISGRSGGGAGVSMGAAEGLVSQGIAGFDPFSFSQRDAAFVNGGSTARASPVALSALPAAATKTTVTRKTARNI